MKEEEIKIMEQRHKIQAIRSSGKYMPLLPSCGGSCDECDYRRAVWEEELGEELLVY